MFRTSSKQQPIANNGLTKSGNNFRLGGTLTGNTTIILSGNSFNINGVANSGLTINSTSDNPSIRLNSAASGNNRNWSIEGDGNETLRGLTIYRSTTAGGNPTTVHSKFRDDGDFIVGANYNDPHFIYDVSKNSLAIGVTHGGDFLVQNYDFIQGNNNTNNGTGQHNLLKGNSYQIKGVSSNNYINGDGFSIAANNLTDLRYNIITQGASSIYRDLDASILIGSNQYYNESGTTLSIKNLYNIQIGNHNRAGNTHHLIQFGTGLRNIYGTETWGDWTYQPKFYFGNNNVILTGSTSKATFVIANGYIHTADWNNVNSYESNSFTHLNNGWTQINTTNNGFLFSGGTSLTEEEVIPKAALEVVSTTSGFLPPKMTATQVEAITLPPEGLMVYSTSDEGLTINSNGWWGYDGNDWINLGLGNSTGDTETWGNNDDLRYVKATGNTTNGTTLTLLSYTLDNTSVYSIKATVKARQTSGANRALYDIKALAYREGGGATLEGGGAYEIDVVESTGAASWDGTIDVSGNDIRIRVTGAAATTINWHVVLELQKVS